MNQNTTQNTTQTTQNKTPNRSRQDREEIGVLWKRKAEDGTGYLSGKIKVSDDFGEQSEESIVIFKNKYQREGKQDPDYIILKKKGKQSRENSPNAEEKPKRRQAEPVAQESSPQSVEEVEKDGSII